MGFAKFCFIVCCCVISAVGLLGVIGGSIVLKSADMKDKEPASIVTIAIGAIFLFLGLQGLYSSIREIRCILIMFILEMAIILIILLALVIVVACLYRNNLPVENLEDGSFNMYSKDNIEKTYWDELQSAYECCGIKGLSDWGTSPPYSCCRSTPEKNEEKNPFCSTQSGDKNYMSTIGCEAKLMGTLHTKATLFYIAASFLLIAMFGSVLFGIFVAKNINKEE